MRRVPAARGPDFEASGLRRILVAIVLLKIAGLVVVFTWNGQLGFDLPKALWSRALEWPTAGILALALYRHGLALIPRTRAHILVVGFVLANAVSALLAENTYIALYGERNRYLGLTNVIDMAVLYLATVVAFRRLRDWAVLAAVAGGAVLVAVGYGAVQYAGRDPIIWAADPRVRPFGTIGNPDMYGHLLATTVAACAALAFVAPGRTPRFAAISLGMASLALLAIVGTRGSVIALVATLAVGGILGIGSQGRAGVRPRAAIVAIAGAIALAAVLAFTPTGQRLLSAAPTADRVLIWTGSWRAFLERPLFGWGPDSLAVVFPSVRPDGMEAVFNQRELLNDEAHNWILQALATTGIVGGVALVALVVGSTVLLARERHSPLAVVVWPLGLAALAYWGNALTSPDSVSIGWIPWIIFAATARLVSSAPVTVPAIRWLPRPIGAGILGITLLAAATGWPAYRANAEILRAVVAYPTNAAETIAGANAAITLDPGRGDYYNYRGLGFQLRGQFSLAATDFDEATRRVPYQSAYWINLSRARMFQVQNNDQSGGGARAALAAAKRAIDSDPRIHAPHRNYAEVALALGEPMLAFDEARVAFAMYTRDPLTDAVLAASATRIPDRELARRVIEAALAEKNSPVLWAGLAQVHLAAGNPTAARAAALQALALDPNNAEALMVAAATGGP